MKKLFFVLILLFSLTGCAPEDNTENQAAENKTDKSEQTEKTAPKTNEDIYVPNPQVTDDINLVTVGETITDAKGELTLKAYDQVNETVKIGPVEMVIKDIKVLHFVPDYSMIDFFHAYTHEEEFDFVKVAVEVKNTSNHAVKFNPIAALEMNSGEHKTYEDDIYLEELTGEIESNGVKKGNMGFILQETDDIQSVELLTSDAVDKSDKIIEKGKNIKLDL
ncbi:DUF4352 domain-containing protein [Bacillus canaveralius]|uniref:DUF4352 domain-containing protein n=1 Tax=Bacillus canaveralius TaxID=1403243 RepID=A0A2N5GPB6_9BACI|nr:MULTISPECIES: DUF4352 domain-containing protein [Bacillus]PLR84392.1 DUF4352 domain-containing protein [Bacillus canaveralius]PLR87024.1 DUF4352 domain-containing protein [Bacillus sp. V33-4]PLS00606.1 DUF4352 domain-containing protein [Bacillus canaveralius]RSK57893.1 DUF4352 domain-containing protein [Bacillus canaveralius]